MTRHALLAASLLAVTLAAAPAAYADLDDETALAERYAPVVRLVEQVEECGPGEPYEPLDVDALFGQSTVALRGPWNPSDLVKIAPTGEDLSGLYEYHLDFPGDALDPGCDYEVWARRLPTHGTPAVYAHVATDPVDPATLALQYWFFYPFNDFNNLHEGDWEMIQLLFDAPDAASALAQASPSAAGYSSHEGAERADWGDDKLELVDGTHPVVYPAAGSHANKFTEALYLGSSAEQGVGCDDTRGPHRELRPAVKVIPSDPRAARAAFPWITFEGRWGELQTAFFNGPTGPNLKRQWTEPVTWADDWRSRSYAVPTGGVFGTDATDFFCSAVATGSRALVGVLRSPGLMVLVLLALAAFAGFVATRTTWRPVAPLRAGRRRTWGQILAAAGSMYLRKAPLFVGIGLVFLPISIAITVLQGLLLGGFGLTGVDTSGASAGAVALGVVVVGTVLTLFGVGLVQAATVRALVEIDDGRATGPWRAYRLALERIRPLFGSLAIAVPLVVVLGGSAVLAPVALWLAIRWTLLAPVAQLEATSTMATLRGSARLVRHRWLRVASLIGIGGALALAAGPFLGALLILATDAPLALLNVVAGVVYALAMPFVALTTSYVYFDARARMELAPAVRPEPLPAEIELSR